MPILDKRTRCRSHSLSSCWLGFVVLFFISGCNSQPTGDIVDTVPASGKLSFQGKPLEYFQVTLIADGKRPAVGTSDSTGSFVLGTNKEKDGAEPGEYRVAITYVGPLSTDPNQGINEFAPPPPPKVKIPTKYGDPKKSGLSVTIPKNGNSTISLEIQ